ncbi:MAG TPA: glycerol-3-phosphate 1-O-acyltransferase PlsY [Candidatus Didemnitutus sp.]|nr:glycerol-3-phosphate 1-O-acyltransferase PlsY [Candidatus Didemnitutus sp.]
MAYGPYILAAVIGYFLGALPFGYLVARAHGVDIFKAGSGNPGATNVKRVLGEKFGAKGKRAGNLVFALDAVKGAVAAAIPLLVGWYASRGADIPEDWTTVRMHSLTGVIAAILGHSFSIFTKFKGGKGVATAAGGLVVLMPVSCLIGGAVWVLTFFATRYVSLGSILAAVAVPSASWLRGNPLALNLVVTAIGLFVIVRHRENVRRLLNGTESKFAKKPTA